MGLPWYDRRQGRIQSVYHGMIEGRGGSRVFTMVCWKAGRIQRVYHGMLEGRGRSSGFSMVCWLGGRADPECLP